MKSIIAISLLVISLAQTSWARRGENDGSDDDRNESHLIECVDKEVGQKILSFNSSEGVGEVTKENYDLKVKSRGDDVGEMTIIERNTLDQIKSKRLEELLKVTLTSKDTQAPIIAETSTHRGQAQIHVIDSDSMDKAEVRSYSRKGASRMQIIFTLNEAPKNPINIICRKVK